MIDKFVKLFEHALELNHTGISHPEDARRFYEAIFKMIHLGLTPDIFEGLHDQFDAVINKTFPGFIDNIKSRFSSDFYAMHFAITNIT